ncbi:hypothetical protein [Nocardioides sp. LS1]|uniref:hypothetical protein n=1 Tax=Nocardioides sp. LS1 TaxID=1027620 RepID=UPI000F61B5CD|nr:hypothetical protein [Nocardioides sp. LS1]GCD88778.1 hypothetical protein NLS1_07840 [Nocardioides sp. LS1]
MSRLTKLVVLAVALTFALATAASAALPKAGATYAGGTSDGDGTIKIAVETQHLITSIKVVDSCGTTTTFKNVKVKDDGTFRNVIKHPDYDIVVAKVKGTFTSKTVAKGTFSQVACTGADATFKATRR